MKAYCNFCQVDTQVDVQNYHVVNIQRLYLQLKNAVITYGGSGLGIDKTENARASRDNVIIIMKY